MKLTRRQRYSIYLMLRENHQAAVNQMGLDRQEQAKIWKEFNPGPHKEKSDGRPRGIRHNLWYCENGCGKILRTKTEDQVFIRPWPESRNRVYFCSECLKKYADDKKQK